MQHIRPDKPVSYDKTTFKLYLNKLDSRFCTLILFYWTTLFW